LAPLNARERAPGDRPLDHWSTIQTLASTAHVRDVNRVSRHADAESVAAECRSVTGRQPAQRRGASEDYEDEDDERMTME
jgi:hypothetical protein